MAGTPARADEAGSPRRGRWRRLAPTLAAYAVFLFLIGLDVSIRHAWIALRWPEAEAVIVEVSPPGPRHSGFRGPKGFPHDAAVSIRTDDGRVFAGRTMEPLFSLHDSREQVPAAANRLPPRVGDSIRVHLHPSGDGRVMPRDNLHHRGGTLTFLSFTLVIMLINLVRLDAADRNARPG